MRKHLPTFLLLPLALALYALPGAALSEWRLGVWGFYVRAAEAAGAREGAERSSSDSLTELRDRIIQKDLEIARLRRELASLTEAKEHYPQLRFCAATVLARPGGLQSGLLVIDRGFADQLRFGDAVIQGQALAGSVSLLSGNASEVRLLTHPESCVVARAHTPRERDVPAVEDCAVQGAGSGQARVVFYASEARAVQGSQVLTSGLLGILPPDLLVGELAEDPQPGPEPNTLEAPLILRADALSLSNLLVLHRAGAVPDGEGR